MISRTAPLPRADALPRHVAIVIDGNRRWAHARGLPSGDGQHAGTKALRSTVEAAARIGLECLSVYALSEEGFLHDFALAEAPALARQNVRVRAIGRLEELPAATSAAVQRLLAATERCEGMRLNLALNYGARTELGDAVKALALDVKGGKLALEAIDDDSVARYLYTAGLPDPDLLIRTGGELRVSNFLLYQIAYAELWATTTPWPDFDERLLRAALAEFAARQRRFGS